jgi:predicted acyltransferase
MTEATGRLHALDVFRGVTIAAMILVSTPGSWESVYPVVEHAPWNGCTLADFVFPFLLFAMGAAVPFALGHRAARAESRGVRRHVLRRAAVLFALGLLLNAIETPPPLRLATFRIPGVLQRIALVYLVVSWITQRLSARTQIGVAGAALVGYWISLAAAPLTAEANFGAVIDRHVFGRHMLHPMWDPEGLLSTVPAVASALAGVFAGNWLKERSATHRAAWLWAAGAAAMLIAVVWARVLPLNKNLWTSSFALFTAGAAAQLLAIVYWIVDVKDWRGWSQPFVAFGRNPLAAYFLSVGLDAILARWTAVGMGSLKGIIYRTAFSSWLRPCCGANAASLAYALAYVALWGVVLSGMYRRRVFIGI